MPGITHEHHLGAALAGLGQHAAKLAAADHARLINHQHVARAKPLPALRPSPFERGDGAALDFGVFLQALGRLASQCCAAHREPLPFESGLDRLQHPGFASACRTRYSRDPLRPGHMPHRGPLLGRQLRVRVQSGVYVRGAHAMRSGPRQALGLGHHIALGLDHRPRGEARGAPAFLWRELPEFRRGHDPREDRLERRAVVHVAIDLAGGIPAGEYGLPVGDKLKHAFGPLRDLAGALGAGLFELVQALGRLPPAAHALHVRSLVRGRRDIDAARLMGPVVDPGIVPGARQVQVGVVRPLLAQLQNVGPPAPWGGIADAPVLAPQHLAGFRVPARFLPGSETVLGQWPHRQQDMRVDVSVLALMDGPIRRQPPRGELLGHKFARQLDVLVKRKLGRKRNLDLAGELRILAVFGQLDAVPKRLRSGYRLSGVALQKCLRPRRGILRHGHFRMPHIGFVAVVPSLGCVLGVHARGSPVSGGGYGALPLPSRHDLCMQMVDRHAVL